MACLPVKIRSSRAQFFDGLGQGQGRGPGVGAGKGPVGKEHRGIGPVTQGLPQGRFGLGRTHGEHRDLAALGVLDPQPLLQGVEVKGIDDGLDAFPLQGMGHRVQADFLGVGHLFDADDDVSI